MKTFKQFLDEARLNKTAYDKTFERLTGAKFGFELEMFVSQDTNYFEHDSNWLHTAEMIATDLGDELGQKVHVVKSTEDTSDVNTWQIMKDGSIDSEDIGYGVEIVSPPQAIADAFDDLRTCFSFMSKAGFETNSTTGMHINLSIPGLADKLDSLKLILFMGEEHVLKTYERSANSYAKTHLDDILASVKATGKIPKSAYRLEAIATSALSSEKYRTVNLSKLKHGYLEFRTAGNDNYHKKFKQIQDDVGRFLTVLELACDPEAEKQLYLKKLVKVFNLGQEKDTRTALAATSLQDFVFSNVGSAAWDRFLTASKTGERAESALNSIMYHLGQRIISKEMEIPPKIIAEFKVMLNKMLKMDPEVMRNAKSLSRNQVELDALKAFMKAFNLK